jgi:hypothetical protein
VTSYSRECRGCGGGSKISPGARARDPFLSREVRSVEADWSDESDSGVVVA